FSSRGPSCLHGPHHGAQKSTMTGTLRDVSMTSAMKPLMSLSLMRSAAPLVLAALSIGSISATRWLKDENPPRRRRDGPATGGRSPLNGCFSPLLQPRAGPKRGGIFRGAIYLQLGSQPV